MIISLILAIVGTVAISNNLWYVAGLCWGTAGFLAYLSGKGK
jgi:hypothetical protein